jgi:small-conductance mechanosensitive channel
MSETFKFDVAYGTTFEDLEKLRDKMLFFLKTERRDYQPLFDVAVVGEPSALLALFSVHSDHAQTSRTRKNSRFPPISSTRATRSKAVSRTSAGTSGSARSRRLWRR